VLTAKPVFAAPEGAHSDLDVSYVSSPGIRPSAYATERLSARLAAAIYHADLWFFKRAALRWLGANARRRNYDVIQVCSLFGLAEAILGRWAIPTVAWLPGIPSGRARSAIKRLVHVPGFQLFSRGDPVRYVKERMGVESIDTIEPGLELDKIDAAAAAGGAVRERMGIPPDALAGITVARLVPVKNVEFLLEGLARAVRTNPRLHHLIVGDGSMSGALKAKSKSLGLSRNVHFLGRKKQDDVYALLAGSDFFALTSTYENFSNAALEAMAHGLPVIGSEVGYLEDLLRDSGAGLAVRPGDVEGLEGAIGRLVSDAGLREELSRRGGRFARQFDWPVIAEKLVAVYEKAREAGRGG